MCVPFTLDISDCVFHYLRLHLVWTPDFQLSFRPWFEFSWKVRVTRSNHNKLLKEVGLYLLPRNDFGWMDGRLWLCPLPPPPPCLNPRFSVIFPEGEGDEIKSKQASRTLPFTLKWLLLDGRTSLIVSYHYTSSSTLFFNNPQCAMKTHCDTFYDSFFVSTLAMTSTSSCS